jgi:hypothetical protein
MRLLSALACALTLAACERSETAAPTVSSAPPPPPIPPRPIATRALPAPKAPSFDEMVKQSEPLVATPAAQDAGGRRISAERCELESGPFLGKSTLDVFKAIEAAGGRVLLVDQYGRLAGFSPEKGAGCRLGADKSFGEDGVLKLPHKIENLTRDGTGRVIASNGIFAAYAVEQGKQAFVCDTKGHVELHRSGKWGIAPYVNASVRLVEVEAEGCRSEDWVLQNLNDDAKRQGPFGNVSASAVLGNLVLIGGVLAKREDERQPRMVAGYTRAGKETLRFGNPEPGAEDRFDWIHAIDGCKAGICVLDSNLRRLSVWSKTGKQLASVRLDDLFGVSSPWAVDFAVDDRGDAWFAVAAERGKSGVSEGLVFRVRGL